MAVDFGTYRRGSAIILFICGYFYEGGIFAKLWKFVCHALHFQWARASLAVSPVRTNANKWLRSAIMASVSKRRAVT